MKTPECDKMKKVQDKSQAIGEFLEWMQSEKNITFSRYHRHGDGSSCDDEDSGYCSLPTNWPMPITTDAEKLLAEFFEIDLNKVEQEKRDILDEIRKVG